MRSLACLCGLAALLGASVAVAAHTPSLVLVRKAPLEVRGSGFRPHMAVRVVETSPAARVVVLRTSSTGTFVAELLAGDPCAAILVRAVGRSGERASLRIPPARLCAPAGPGA